MSALRAGARRWAGILLLALVSLGATRGGCPMLLGLGAEEASGHGCCGEGIASKPPSCCDAGLRAPEATARGSASHLAAPARAFVHESLSASLGTPFSGPPAPLAGVHSPPRSILRI